MAAIINIQGKDPIDDPEYRYKMPRLMCKIEGRGNGIKTAITNMRELANALHREPGEVTKFFGCELGAQTKWTDDTDKSIVNGAHTDQVLQQLLHKYIDIFVLCPNCRLPESHYRIKGGRIYHKCMACGARDEADNNHKLATYILNTAKKEKEKSKKDKDKKDKNKDKDKDKDKERSSATTGSDENKKEKKKKDKKKDKDKENDRDSERKQPSSEEEIPDEDDMEFFVPDQTEDQDIFDNCVSSIKRQMEENVTTEQMVDEVKTAAKFSGFSDQYRLPLYIATYFDDKTTVTPDDIEACKPVIRALCSSPADQRYLIGAFESLCAVRRPVLLPFFPVILKLLYDADLLEEDVVLEWAKEGHSEAFTMPLVTADMSADLVNRAQPFIDWLSEADEESEEEEEDED